MTDIGVCYYPEHWPEADWPSDAARMREIGARWVRVGEFAWSRLEPRRGAFDFDWLERAIDGLAREGLEVVMCTPTATPPKWLIDERPEILAWDENERPRRFGSRRHYCFGSPAWLDETMRITEAVARRFGGHEAVAAWQLDNEYGCHDTVLSFAPHMKHGFRAWLRARYGSIEALNREWGAVFWSMEAESFEAIDPPNLTVTEANPAHRLAYRRYCSELVARYNALQAEIVRAHSPGRPISHNFMGFFTEFAHAPVARELDFVSWDSYPLGFTSQKMRLPPEAEARWARTGHPDVAAFHHDLYRGLGRGGRWWVMEQQPGPVNWAPYNPAPSPGMVRLWTLEAAAHGAEAVCYFRWRQAPFAQEQFHAGLLRPDGALAPGGEEARKAARDLAILREAGLGGAGRAAPVVLLHDEEAAWALEIQPQGADFDYFELVMTFYQAARRLGFDVDVKRPGEDLAGAKLVLAPCLPIFDREAVSAIERSGAFCVAGPRLGSRTVDHAIPDGLAPGAFRALLPFVVERAESLPPGVRDAVAWRGRRWEAGRWRERIACELAPSGVFDDGAPAIVENDRAAYFAHWPDIAALSSALDHWARELGLAPTPLPESLRIRRRGELNFCFNYGDAPAATPGFSGTALLGGAETPPRGVSVWRS